MSNKSILFGVLLSLTVIVLVSGLVPPVYAQVTYTVTNADDSGTGSLRWAITQANSNAGTDTIDFNISGEEVHTITLASGLPEITESVIIDGLSQPGAGCATWPPTLLIELDGSSAGPGAFGLSITAGGSTIRGLVIHSFNYSAIRLATNGNNVLNCNYLGTDPTGTMDLGNYHGVNIQDSAGNQIGGGTVSSRNLISGNGATTIGSGVRISGVTATGNAIKGNYIGTDSLGVAALGNASCGVQIDNAPDNIVGGGAAGEGNLISSNGRHGIWISGSSATGTVIRGNSIGVDAGGTEDLGNAFIGVFVDGVANSIIGGTGASDGNLISGNTASGVRIAGSTATGTLIQGNYIGLQDNGRGRQANGDSGVYIDGAPNNTIGGTTSSARNVISGNTFSGVSIYGSGATGNVILGNYIGTRANGTERLSNSWSGVYIDNAPGNIVGGTAAGARNLISGNAYHGVYIGGIGATANLIQGNDIGTGLAGTEILGNTLHGLYITTGASDNRIGGLLEGEPNLIINNGGDGVYVESGSGNLISANSILSNGGLGIDLQPDSLTDNDPGDADTGANNLQNFPILDDVITSGSDTVILGSLNSIANTTFRLEFYYSTAPDPTGYGEGAFFLGAQEVATDGSGDAQFMANIPIVLPDVSYVTATATDPDNNTSEFGPNYVGPTAVLLSDFRAWTLNQGIGLEWDTTTEAENLGFNLYRATALDGPRTRLNQALIATLLPGSPLGATYTWQDDRVKAGITYYYWLQDVNIFGVVTEHGPVPAVAPWHRCFLPLVSRGE